MIIFFQIIINFCLWFLISPVFAAEKGEFVIELNSTTFTELVISRKPDDYFLVEFYNPLCGACKNFAPEYARIAESFRGLFKVGRISTSPEDHKPITQQYEITVVPNIILFLPSNPKPIYFGFDNPRTPLMVTKWITPNLPIVITLNSIQEEISNYLCSEDNREVFPSRFLWLYGKESMEDMSMINSYRGLAETKHGEAVFAEVDVSGIEEEIGQQFNISGYPAILVVIGLHGTGQKFRVLNKNWKESIKDFWEDIDASVLDSIYKRTPYISLQSFTICFLILSLFIVCYFIRRTSKYNKNTRSELTSVSWGGDTKTD